MINYQIGERIKKLRKARGLSQADFAKRLGVHKGHISRLETGTANPSEQLLNGICREFEARKEWIIYGDTILQEKDGFSIEQIEFVELGTDRISQGALLAEISEDWVTIVQMIDRISRFHASASAVGKPGKLLLAEKTKIINVVDGLRLALNSLFDRLEAEDEAKARKLKVIYLDEETERPNK